MEIERFTQLPHSNLHRHQRKRRRSGWDSPRPSKVLAASSNVEKISVETCSTSSGVTSEIAIASSPSVGVAQNDAPACWFDEKDGHYMFQLGENLNSRYKIRSQIGQGTFGRVVECWDDEKKEMVAIKIVRAVKKYRDDAMIEIDMLQQLGKNDKFGSRIVQLRNWFDYRNHICIVFEKLGPSLYDFLSKNEYRSFPIDLVRKIGRQLLECVALMHDMHLIHTDLKPENILLVSSDYVIVPHDRRSSRERYKKVPKSSAIKVIDFGSTTHDEEDQTYVVSTRHYRAPEVILGIGWSYPCDIWSIGCILVELCSGDTLFQTRENLEHLAMMERVLGELPRHMLHRASGDAKSCVRSGRLRWPDGAASGDSIRAVRRLARLEHMVKELCCGELVHLLHGLLRFDPSLRLTARQALSHSFFAPL